MKLAVLFPGQGSQFIGMGQDFTKQNTACNALLAQAEACSELPLGTLCNEGPMEELIRATNLQPAITVTNLVCYQAFQEAAGGEFEVSCFAGHSLGEYSALCAAGVIGVEDTIRLVAKRGALMEREGVKNPGGMRAVLGLPIETVNKAIGEYQGDGVITAANHNTPEQIVISGSFSALDEVGKVLADSGGKVIPLNVSVANHSPLVAEAVPDFTEFMADIRFNVPQVPVYFNVSAARETEPAAIKEMMARQIASPVRWCEIIQSMVKSGVDTFIEVGPKTVLKGMLKKIAGKGDGITALQFDSPESLGSCLSKLRELRAA